MLNFDSRWRFTSPGAIGETVSADLFVFIKKVAAQHSNRQHVIEHYKTYFAEAAGHPSYTSTSLGWAETDLMSYMTEAAANAPLFIEAFFDAGISMQIKQPNFVVPDVAAINSILAKHDTGYELDPPNLIFHKAQTPIALPDKPPSLDEQAHAIIQRSQKQSEEFLALGQGRQAVQELLWLLETVSTAFQGLPIGESTVEGKYRTNCGGGDDYIMTV